MRRETAGLHMPKSSSFQLASAKRTRRFVRFERRFEDSPVRGYVLDVGPEFFLLALVSDRLWFDGFECFRTIDARNARPDPYARFRVRSSEAPSAEATEATRQRCGY